MTVLPELDDQLRAAARRNARRRPPHRRVVFGGWLAMIVRTAGRVA